MNNILRLIYAISVSSLLVSCGNSLGPENDPSIKITTYNVPSKDSKSPAPLQKTCVFVARVLNDVDGYGVAVVKPVSNVWNEKIKLECFTGDTVRRGDLVYVEAGAVAYGEEGSYEWGYAKKGESGWIEY